ncbi:MAG TPA: hypothetical protein VH142_25140, partial [Polyangiaceae bacterium]|nr:hypothetical protein [Polyangiaceae bacterium]
MAAAPFAVKRIETRRRAQRDTLWPDATDVVFQTVGGGWCRMPRTIPMIASLIDRLIPRENAGRLYLALWAYEYGDGFVEVPDPAQVALEAGYMTNRAERTFTERIATLRSLGFIRTAAVGMRDNRFVLLLDPHAVLAGLRKQRPEAVPDRWWSAFVSRCATVGIQLP